MELLISAIKVIIIPVVVLTFIPLLIWIERKGAAYIQDRRGPNRANILGIRLGGIVQNFADVVKLLMKEDFIPANANRFYFLLAPFITMFIYFVTTAVIPFADDIQIGTWTLSLQAVDLNVGVLYVFSMASLAVYGIMLAGWSSGNKYSFLGALRASSQMISYEIAMGLAVVSLFMLAGSVNLNEIVRNQSANPFSWNLIRQPLAFLLFLVASFAEANRTPFDLPEGESELVAGFHVEYSSMKFALFFMGEYTAIIVASAIIVSLFVGGWQVPFISTQDLIASAPYYLQLAVHAVGVLAILLGLLLVTRFRRGKWKDARDYEVLVLGIPSILVGVAMIYLVRVLLPVESQWPVWLAPVFAAVVQFAVFIAKILFFCFFFVWIRWTLPRFRYDQLMSFGWKGMLPAALVNVLVTGLILIAAAQHG